MKKKLEKNSSFTNGKISVQGLIWREKNFDKKILKEILENHDISTFLAKLMVCRGINISNYESFLKPKIKDQFPNPSLLVGVDKATDLIVEYILNKKKIAIFGDYDVDGITSTSLIGQYFDAIKCPYEFYIPDRTKEGYGPNIKAFNYLSNKNCELIITVDCGTTAKNVINTAAIQNIKVIIVDHHQPDDSMPNAFSIINPNQNNKSSDLKNLAAVGVTFLLLVSINRKLRSLNFFENKFEPNLINYLDFVALGTVCDVVELKGLNRAFVKQGLKVFNKTKNYGLISLIESSGIQKEIDEYHLGYILGPKINAGGRVGNSKKGVELLLTKNRSHSIIIAEQLSELNLQRQKIEKKVEESARKKIDLNDKIICVSDKDWHEGVIGIVAGKLVERFIKPSIVISESDKICKGSARSLSGFDIGLLIKNALTEGIIESGGGHKMAGGLSIKKENIKLLKNFLKNYPVDETFKKIKEFDTSLFLSSINNELFNDIKILSPHGSGNPKPKFCISNCFVKFPKLVGSNHIVCFLSDIYGNSVKGIAFNSYDNAIGEEIMGNNGKLIDVIGEITVNEWNNNKVLQIQINDIIN